MNIAAARSRGLIATALGLVSSVPLAAAEPKISFTRQIKPILADKCFACHGPDEKERQGRDAAGCARRRRAARDQAGRCASTASWSCGSRRDDPDLQMPPAESKKPALTADEIALIRKWIDQGAEYDAHWAYVTPKRPDRSDDRRIQPTGRAKPDRRVRSGAAGKRRDSASLPQPTGGRCSAG